MRGDYDIIIVGAGLVGSALAALLSARASGASNAPLKIALVERAAALTDNPMPNQRVVALGKAATDVLQDVGVFDALGSEYCHAYRRMFVWDENSRGELHFSADEFSDLFDQSNHVSEFESPEVLGHMIDSVQCNLFLQQAVMDTNTVDTFFSCQPECIEFSDAGAQLALADRTFSAPLIVAADGARSWVRQQARLFANHQSYQQRGIVARIRSEKSHQDTAWQRFLSSGPVAILPLSDNQSSIVWSVDNENAETLMAADDKAFCQRLKEALEGRLGDIELLSPRAAFDLQSQRAERYIKKHLALVGDAAHSIHPLAGQGANLGFKDIVSLASVLSNTPPSEFGQLNVLQRYQRARKADNEQTDLMMSALHRVYQNDTPLWLAARGLGMNWLSGSTTLKRLLAKQAMGI